MRILWQLELFVLNPMHEIFLILKNIVELHSILLALTCSCTLILASSNIELIADCQ